MAARYLALSLFVAVAVVVCDHLLFGELADRRVGQEGRDLAGLEARVRALETAAAPRPEPSLAVAPSGSQEVRLQTLEKRLAQVETALSQGIVARREAPAPSPAPQPLAEGDVPPVIREAREQAARMRREQSLRRSRDAIRQADQEGRVSPEDAERAAVILCDRDEAIRDLYEGKEHASPEERQALRARYEALEQAAEADLTRVLPPDLAQRLSGRQPLGGSSSAGR